MMSLAPIALFVYKRLEHTHRTIESLKNNSLAIESDLFIFSDHEKNPKDRDAVQSVRDYVKGVTGFRSVRIIDRPINFGLAKSIIDGVSRLCGEFGRVIVLEDDLVTSPNFLEYMNRALDRYAEDDRVMQISGYMFPLSVPSECDAFFLPFVSSWGWATWQRAWHHFDEQAMGFQKLQSSRKLRKSFDLNNSYSYFQMLTLQQLGKVDSWAIRWYLSVFLNDGVILYPRVTLVRNIGFDGSGTNCGELDSVASETISDMQILIFPEMVCIVNSHKNAVYSYLKYKRNSNLFRRIFQRARRFFEVIHR